MNASPLPTHHDRNSSVSCVLAAAEKSDSILQIGENGEHSSRPGRWLLFDATCQHGVPPFEGAESELSTTLPVFQRNCYRTCPNLSSGDSP
eukprot:749659-Amphidinium_carterae.2